MTETKTAAGRNFRPQTRTDGLQVYKNSGNIADIVIVRRGKTPFATFTLKRDGKPDLKEVVAFGQFVDRLQNTYNDGERVFCNVVYKPRDTVVNGKTIRGQSIIVDNMGRLDAERAKPKAQGERKAAEAPAAKETPAAVPATAGVVDVEDAADHEETLDF